MSRKLPAGRLALFALLMTFSLGQAQVSCDMPPPSQQWEDWFGTQVEEYVKKRQAGKTQVVNYVIPVIVHIIHYGEAYGTFPNIDSNQVKSQIVALNEDFGGVGYNSGNVPSYFAGLKANTGIQFCLAAIDYTGTGMNEKGIHRVSAAALSWSSPSTPTLNLKQYFYSVVIPATIWPPDKYLNIWVSDKPPGYPLNGFGTYPSGSGLIGLFGDQPYGTTTNDGIWCWAAAFGTQGSVQAPTNKGRTATHYIGHWLGLRHIWGDGNCLSDYVNDTPVSKGPHTGCVPVPTPINACGVNMSPNGEMPMNFMDLSDDDCKYMFTQGQNLRMQTALNQAPLRYPLGSHGICMPKPAPPSSSAVATFTMVSDVCTNLPYMPFNTSSGYPNPNYLWSSSPAALFNPNTSVANPMITFQNNGSYTVTLVATNSLSSSSWSVVVNAQGTCQPQPVCLDSIRMIKKPDTLAIYKAPSSNFVIGCQTGPTGYLVGTNCYKDREFAQFYPFSSFTSVPYPQVHSLIVLFDSAGTKSSNTGATVSAKIYGGSVSSGPIGMIGTAKTETLSTIAGSSKTTSVTYIGKSGYIVPNRKIIPYKFDFNQPIVITTPSSGFYASVEGPNLYPSDSISIYSNTKTNPNVDSSAWFMNSNGTWRTYRMNRSAKIQLALIPQISCSPIVGIKENTGIMNANVTVMPNPGSGRFSLVFTLPEVQNEVAVKVYNTYGQLIISESLYNVSSDVVDLDLSSQGPGIYYTEMSNGTEKVVRKLILLK